MLELLVAGETDPVLLAHCARGRMKEKIPQLERALAGRFGPQQRFLVARQLAHIDFLDRAIEEVSAEVATRRGVARRAGEHKDEAQNEMTPTSGAHKRGRG